MPADEPGATGDLRRDLVLEQRNAAGQVAIAYRFPRCWPSQFTPLPELDAGAGVVALASLTLQHEGFERVGDEGGQALAEGRLARTRRGFVDLRPTMLEIRPYMETYARTSFAIP